MKSQPAKVIVHSSYNSPQAAQFLSERSKIPTVMLPFTVGGTERAKDLVGFFDDMIGRLLGVVK
jgi:zinc/manganese transport system substrate-binding protein